MLPDFLFTWPESAMFLVVLVATSLVALAIHALHFLEPVKRLCSRLGGLSPVLQTICGTLFVLSVTFLANTVWETEDRARATVYEEARNLRIMWSYIGTTTGPTQDGLSKLMEDYAKGAASEWDDMAMGGSAKAEQALTDFYRAVVYGLANGEENRLLQQRMLAALDSLSLARAERLSMAQEEVSSGQWFTVISLGLLLLVVISVCHSHSAQSRAAALLFVVFAVSISLHVIIAHDRPFFGRLAITPDAIVNAVMGS